MPTIEWLKKEFDYGYQSGEILSDTPDSQRLKEEKVIGGSYREFFLKIVVPLLTPHAKVLELGPGAGSWSRALLHYLPQGELHTCDFQDVRQWLKPEKYDGRLHCHTVQDNSFASLPDDYFDLFFSFGVLVHCNQDLIAEILHNARPKMKKNAYAVHNHGDWHKLTLWGWEKGKIPLAFKYQDDDAIWWPRNTGERMLTIATNAGWTVTSQDTQSFHRDGIIVLQNK